MWCECCEHFVVHLVFVAPFLLVVPFATQSACEQVMREWRRGSRLQEAPVFAPVIPLGLPRSGPDFHL